MPTSPTMLNQPVNQLQPGPPRRAAHQYGPPAVGKAEVSSDIDTATSSTKQQITGQPIEAAIGPPAFHAWPNVVNVPARTEMIVNEIAKFEKLLHARTSSCLYPSSASLRSSRSSVRTSAMPLPSSEVWPTLRTASDESQPAQERCQPPTRA